jgi:putative lipoprotein
VIVEGSANTRSRLAAGAFLFFALSMKRFQYSLCVAAIILMSACRSNQTDQTEPVVSTVSFAPLGNFQWNLVELNGASIAPSSDKKNPHLIFIEPEQRIAGSTGCNRIMGAYTRLPDGSLQIGPLATTMMACPDMEIESAFLEAVRSSELSQVQAGSLKLLDSEGHAVARFEAGPLPE